MFITTLLKCGGVTMAVLAAALSLAGYFTRDDINRCEMTWMYEWPEYIPVPFEREVHAKFPNYGLYIYGEGRFDLRGFPVLFLPGNAGSYRQVRSLASVALRKTIAYASKKAPHFDFFTADFDEELSGVYGGYLERQTAFAAHCIHRIFSLYPSQHKPAGIVLIGHSMGGIIARGLATYGGIDALKIRMIITLASPHVNPIFNVDHYISDYYAGMQTRWSEAELAGSVQHIVLVSVGGGSRDRMVRSDWTKLPNNKTLTVSTVSSAVPYVWASADHLCIVWCNQLVLSIIRILFDSFDPALQSLSTNRHRIFNVAKFHLMDRRQISRYDQAMKEQDARNLTMIPKHYIDPTSPAVLKTRKNETFLAVLKISDNFSIANVSVFTGQSTDTFAFACDYWKGDLNTSKSQPLWPEEVLPSGLKLVQWSVESGKTLGLLLSSSPRQHRLAYRTNQPIKLQTSAIGRFLWSEQFDLAAKQVLWVRISFQGFQSELQVLKVQVMPNCGTSNYTISDHWASARFRIVNDSSQTLYRSVRYPFNETDALVVKRYPHISGAAYLDIYLDPACQHYTVHLETLFLDSLAQVIRYHVTTIIFMQLAWSFFMLTGESFLRCAMLGFNGIFWHRLLHWTSLETATMDSVLIFGVTFGVFMLISVFMAILSLLVRKIFKTTDLSGDIGRSYWSIRCQMVFLVAQLAFAVVFCGFPVLLFRSVGLFHTFSTAKSKFHREAHAGLRILVLMVVVLSPSALVWARDIMTFGPFFSSDPSKLPACILAISCFSMPWSKNLLQLRRWICFVIGGLLILSQRFPQDYIACLCCFMIGFTKQLLVYGDLTNSIKHRLD